MSLEWAPAAGDLTVTVVPDPLAATSPLTLCEAPVPTHGTVSIFVRPMYDMWNLVSFPVQPANTTVASVMTSVGDKWQAVLGWANGGAVSYYPYLPPEFNTLTDMTAEHGYWIRTTMKAPVTGWDPNPPIYATLRVSGVRLAEDHPLALDAGWNLVSHLPKVPLGVTTALASIDGKYSAVVTFDRGSQSYYPGLGGALQVMKPGMGYWIYATELATLVYPAGMTAANGSDEAALLAPIRQAEGDNGVQHTSTWADFASRALRGDGTPYEAGAVLLALDPQGTICGATGVAGDQGAYGPLACYGDMSDTAVDEGAQRGDRIRIVAVETRDPVGLGVWRGNLTFQRLPARGLKGALPDEPGAEEAPAAD